MSVRSIARAAAASCVLAAALSAGAVASAQSYYGNNNSYQSSSSNYNGYQSHSRHHRHHHHHLSRYDTGMSQGAYESSGYQGNNRDQGEGRYQNEGSYQNQAMNGPSGRPEEGAPRGMESASYTPPAFQVPISRVSDARNALKGAAVRDEDGNSVGSVRDVIASPDGQAEAIRVNVGGMWGVNGKTVVVDAHDFRYEGDRHELTADLSKGQIESLPSAKP